MMDAAGRGFPPGDLRVSDADRDRALSELSEAFQVGRLTADEFDQRSGQALRARTGRELAALLADLPVDGRPAARATVPASGHHVLAVRTVMGASAVAAAGLFLIAGANAVSQGISVVRQSTSYFQPGTRLLPFISANPPMLQGRSVRLPLADGQAYSVRPASSPALGWVGTIMPAAIAVLLVMLIIFLHATRADRDPIDTPIADQ